VTAETSAASGLDAATQTVSAEAMARRPELLANLRQEEQTVWPRLCKTRAMGEIGQFARRLRAWADEAQWTSLRAYADRLEQQVQDFDVDRLPKTLQEFTAIISSLS
jgi:hypothetical protein